MGYSNADRTNSQREEGQQERHTVTAQFVDNRTSSAAQLQIQGMMHSSPQSIAQRKIQTSMQPSLVTQKQAIQCVEDEELLQGKFAEEPTAQLDKKPNNTGLPNQLKAGIESLSGMGMDHVKVHYNSDKPAQLNAHAYAQGSDIHVAPGQEKHVPHEAWHVVQQAQGRVKPTMQMKAGVPVNDDVGLETEADVMGAKALNASIQLSGNRNLLSQPEPVLEATHPIQREERQTTLYARSIGIWRKNMQIIDSTSSDDYVHLSRSTTTDPMAFAVNVAPPNTEVSVNDVNKRSGIDVANGADQFSREHFTADNNVHITLEGRYMQAIHHLASQRWDNSVGIKAGPPVGDYTNLNFGDLTDQEQLSNYSIQQWIELVADEAESHLQANVAGDNLDGSMSDALKEAIEDSIAAIHRIKNSTLAFTNTLIDSTPALHDMEEGINFGHYGGEPWRIRF